jgi:uncharacterized flavoprotein (TIGR03862 family)
MAAETLAQAGYGVVVYDRMASPGRKFLLAGRGGLNMTHSEPLQAFISRYAEAAPWLAPIIAAYPPERLRAWCTGLGQPPFEGSSGRVFPASFRAAPLLRAWLSRLDGLGVRFAGRHRWLGFAAGDLLFETPDGERTFRSRATILALGGASWPRMGSDGGWTSSLRRCGVEVRALRPSNCGILVCWSPLFVARFEGQPLKRIALTACGRTVRGEAIITRDGLEGGAVYAVSAPLRDALDANGGRATAFIDLRPDFAPEALAMRLDRQRGAHSLSNFLRQEGGFPPVSIGLVQEALHAGASPKSLSALVKALPIEVTGTQSITRAISSAGGVRRSECTDMLMLKRMPGVFVAGEMLDWEAPTGGYLLQACFSTGVCAARGAESWLKQPGIGVWSDEA